MSDKKLTGLGGLPQANIFDAIPDFTATVHVRENNPKSEAHLNANRRKFTGDCATVYSLLQKGQVITTKSVYMQYDVSSLPRRFKDLRDGVTIVGKSHIDEQMVYDDKGNNTQNKMWFMYDKLSEETRVKYKIEHRKKLSIK